MNCEFYGVQKITREEDYQAVKNFLKESTAPQLCCYQKQLSRLLYPTLKLSNEHPLHKDLQEVMAMIKNNLNHFNNLPSMKCLYLRKLVKWYEDYRGVKLNLTGENHHR